jgi:hypothetical protein
MRWRHTRSRRVPIQICLWLLVKGVNITNWQERVTNLRRDPGTFPL